MTRADIFDIIKVGDFTKNEKLRMAADLILEVALETESVDLNRMQDDLRQIC